MQTFEQIANEVHLGRFVPFGACVDESIVKNRDGSYCATLFLAGMPFESKDPSDVMMRHDGFSQFVKSLGNECALWSHRIRSKVRDSLSTQYRHPYASRLAHEYYQTFAGYRMMKVDFYLTLVYKPEHARSRLKSFRSLEDVMAYQAEDLRVMRDLISRALTNTEKYTPRLLGSYSDSGQVFSEQLSFYGFLLNGRWQKVPVLKSSIFNYLSSSKPTFEKELVELSYLGGKRYCAMVDINDYPERSDPGILDSLLFTNFEYIETISFTPMSKRAAEKFLTSTEGRMRASEDLSESQIGDLRIAMDDVVSGRITMGEYHYSLAIFGGSPKEVRKFISEADAILGDAGLMCATIDVVSNFAWLAQLPGNWKFRPRSASMSNRNFAGFASMHGFYSGKRSNNPWGEAVTLLKTPNGSPYYFNWHSSPLTERSYDKKYPANTTIIGETGSGKTLLEIFLITMSLKLDPTVIYFDNKRGAELAIRLLGGSYTVFQRGRPTGLNPFWLPNTPETILFIVGLLKGLIPRKVTPREHDELTAAVAETLRAEHKHLRRLSSVYSQLPDADEDCLAAHLRKWCAITNGDLAWVFDNEVMSIDIHADKIQAYDDTDLIDYPEILAVTTSILLFMADSLIDGRRFMYVMAEFWVRLKLPQFAEFASSKQFTIRSKNGFGVFDTQSPSQVLSSPYASAIVEQSPTQIYMSNPKGDRKQYVEGFKVTDAEFDIIKNLGEGSRQFLIKQGGNSTIVTLDLAGLDDYLTTLSTSLDDANLVSELIAKHGQDIANWYPVFKECIAARKQAQLPQSPLAQ